ncbi:MAG: hypothetical protein RL518_571 [Pseudomonadota bacterium]|jgi:hypothetical protein
MQWILSIDLSAQPCDLSLSSVEGNQVEVIAASSARLPLLAERAELCKRDLSTLLESIGASFRKSPTPPQANQGDVQGAEASASTDQVDTPATDPLYEAARESVATLRASLDTFSDWTAVSVIIPPHDHLALNLNLPFGDARNLDRIVDLEVQDVVPFELDDFLVQYAPLGPMSHGNAAVETREQPTSAYDVHVGLMPRLFVKNILYLCKAAGIEPNIMTVPSSALGSVYHLGRDFFSSNSAVVFNRGDEFSMAVFINGEVRVERVLYASKLVAAAQQQAEHPLKAVFTALKLMLAAAERRYGTRVENVYLLGREVKGANLQQLFGRPIQGIQMRDFIKSDSATGGLSPLGAPFAADDSTLVPLSNFRSREFSFTPKIGEFLRAFVGAAKYLRIAVGAVLLAVLCTYLVRAYTISAIEASLTKQIATVIPGFTAPPSEIRSTLMKAETKITEELGVLASPAKVSPLDALLEILKLLPQNENVTINSIKISGTKAQVTGTAPQLSAIETVGKALKSNSGVFSKVTATPGTSAQGKFNFTVELILTQ